MKILEIITSPDEDILNLLRGGIAQEVSELISDINEETNNGEIPAESVYEIDDIKNITMYARHITAKLKQRTPPLDYCNSLMMQLIQYLTNKHYD